MNGGAAFYFCQKLCGKRLESLIHVEVTGLAARTLGDLNGIEAARDGWFRVVGHVGVPDQLARAEEADRLAIFPDVGDDGDFRRDIPVEHSIADRCAVAFAEIAAETDEIGVGERLITKHQDEILGPNAFQRIHGGIV